MSPGLSKKKVLATANPWTILRFVHCYGEIGTRLTFASVAVGSLVVAWQVVWLGRGWWVHGLTRTVVRLVQVEHVTDITEHSQCDSSRRAGTNNTYMRSLESRLSEVVLGGQTITTHFVLVTMRLIWYLQTYNLVYDHSTRLCYSI